MSSLLDLMNDLSDSEDDVDYVPPTQTGEISSDEEVLLDSDDEGDGKKKRKSTKKKVVPKMLDSEGKETAASSHAVDEKKNSNDIYKNFLEEVAAEMNETYKPSDILCTEISASSPTVSEKSGGVNSSQSTSTKPTQEKECNELFEFAGETIAVNNDGIVQSLDSASSCTSKIDDSSDSSKIEKNAPAPTPVVKRKGLESVLGSILNKKQKINTLQKTLIDWKTFKKEEGIEEDLEKFNRGKGGFIERQRFLERSDVRSYEVERDVRLSRSKKRET